MNTNILKYSKINLILVLLFITNILSAQIVHQPEPVSGDNLAHDMIELHMKYPQNALDNKSGGKIVVLFTVDKNGNATNHRTEKSFDEECAAEAIHLVKLIQWKPATKDALPIEYDYRYTVEFSPKTYLRNIKNKKVKFIPEQELPIDSTYAIIEHTDLDIAPKPFFNNKNVTFASYLRSELIYPEHAKMFEISGTVTLSFIIEADGKASNIFINNSVGGGCDNEAVRLIQNLTWIPGVKDGKIVRTHTTQDITFRFGERNYHDGNQY